MATIRERILRAINVDDNGCWRWQKSLRHGYAQIWAHGRVDIGHRVSYSEFVGPIPAGLTIDHKCRVTDCVNPEHLEPVTHQENVRRGMAVAGINARKTECHRGHAFTPANTQIRKNGSRLCLTCWGPQTQGSAA